jgi:hypothetical protein
VERLARTHACASVIATVRRLKNMRVASKIVLGVVPACLITLSALLFGVFITSEFQKFLLASALLGTTGLIWSIVGYSRKSAAVVLTLLLIGIVGILWAGIYGELSGLQADAQNGKLDTSISLLFRLLISSWLILGPAFVGAIQANRAVRCLRGVA